MAQYVEIQVADFNLVAMPENVEFSTAAALGCRYMTSWGGITDRVNVQPGETVVVAGAGGIGLSAIQIAAAFGAEVVAVDIREDALDLAGKLARRIQSIPNPSTAPWQRQFMKHWAGLQIYPLTPWALPKRAAL